ncbi:hypothetical protein CDD82_7500 [Ophiocordyceps australis]|uniref:Uncharacterized protein n=1 Tax=Ophiocordyceps australis TaxID=1399860 RepID=A0A2C5YM28_9HYPO|nr:hypothetical protein CDD82_7500 [Ophiocordyceps australis]
MLMHELSERVSRDPLLSGISVLGLDPGGMASDICRRGPFMTRSILMKLVLPLVAPAMVRISPNGPVRTLKKSAGDVVRACFHLEAPLGRALYLNGSDERQTCPDSLNEEKRKALWRFELQAGRIGAGETILNDWE